MKLIALVVLLTTVFLEAAPSNKIFGSSTLVDTNLNPAISVNGLLLGSYGKLASKPGLRLQKVEANVTGAIDPHFMGSFTLTTEDLGTLNVEEAYFSTLTVPVVTIKGGKFFANFGENNPLHTHSEPFIDKPLVSQTLLGTKGLNSIGVEGSLLMPTPWWMEFSAAAFSSSSQIVSTTPFGSPNPETLAGVFRLENALNLTDVTTLGLGASLALGEGQVSKQNVQVFGADVHLKYLSGKGKGDFAISWLTEFMQSSRPGYASLLNWEKANGFYSTLLFRFSPTIWLGGRMDLLQIKDSDFSTVADYLMIAYVSSESSTIRLQGGMSKTTNEDSKWAVLLQYNMTLGSHPAHAY